MSGRNDYWMTCDRMTVWVAVGADGYISDSASIVKRFRGQPLGSLVSWMTKLGGFRMKMFTGA